MYSLSDKQIDYILNDISARGVGMESLQQNLLDHICCIIERDLEEEGDFEGFYQKTIPTFYKNALWEIEEETISLLTLKNYYHMKKIMIVSGTFSAITMSLGIFFKFMHWPGASMLLVLGICTSSLIFLPLLFTLKAKEQQSNKDKLIIGLGTLSGILMSLSILFKVMHWPFSMVLGIFSVVILGLVFLPVYFFTGIRQEDKKVNTITVSILIIMVSGLWLTLIRTPRSTRLMDVRDTNYFMANERIVETEQKQIEKFLQNASVKLIPLALSQKINKTCQDLKDHIIKQETGHSKIADDFESKDIFLQDRNGIDPFGDFASMSKMESLIALVRVYNALIDKRGGANLKKIPTHASLIEYFETRYAGTLSLLAVLNQLSQVQMYVLQNERELLAVK